MRGFPLSGTERSYRVSPVQHVAVAHQTAKKRKKNQLQAGDYIDASGALKKEERAEGRPLFRNDAINDIRYLQLLLRSVFEACMAPRTHPV